MKPQKPVKQQYGCTVIKEKAGILYKVGGWMAQKKKKYTKGTQHHKLLENVHNVRLTKTSYEGKQMKTTTRHIHRNG